MNPETIIALLSLVGTVAGSAGGVLASNRLSTHRIAQLERKVEKHNNLIERTYQAEASIKSAHKRLDRLEQQKG